MSGAHAGLVPLNLLLLCAGTALLHGLGVVRTARDVLRYAGLALLTGWAALGLAASTALVLGASLALWQVIALLAALTLPGPLLARRVPAARWPALGEEGPWHWLAVAGIAVVGIQLVTLLRRALAASATIEWDAWAFWLPKAKAIVGFGGLDTGPGGYTSLAHPHYPPLVPALEASTLRFLGEPSASLLPLQHWVLTLAFLGALAALLSVRVRPAVLWPGLAALALLPMLVRLFGSSLGDEPLALLVALGGVCSGLWLLGRDPRHAALGAVFLAAAALAKAEGLALALAVGSLVLVLAAWRRPRRAAAPLALVLAPIAAVLPWRLWLRAHDVPTSPDYTLSDLLDVGYLAARVDRLGYAAARLPDYVLDPERWLLTVPLLLLAVVLVAPVRPALALFAAGSVSAGLLGLLLVYWIGQPPVEWYVATSAARAVASPVVLGAALLPLLLGELWPGGRERPG